MMGVCRDGITLLDVLYPKFAEKPEPSPSTDSRCHGFPLLNALIQSIIPADATVGSCDRTDSRTDPTRTTSSIFMRRASSRASGSGLSHNSCRAGSIQSSMAYFRPKTSRWRDVGGSKFIQRIAISRMLAKPHRVDKSRIDTNSSSERSAETLKSLSQKKFNGLTTADPGIRYTQRI
jgi:hypothetical protein